MSTLSNLHVHLRSKGKHKKIGSVYRFLRFLPVYYLFKHKLELNIIKNIFQNNKRRLTVYSGQRLQIIAANGV